MTQQPSAPLSMRASKRYALLTVLGVLAGFLALSCANVRVDPNRVTAASKDWSFDVVTGPDGTLERVYVKGPQTAKFGETYTVRTGVLGGHPWINIYRNETQY